MRILLAFALLAQTVTNPVRALFVPSMDNAKVVSYEISFTRNAVVSFGFDEGTGDMADDYLGHVGTLENVKWVAGKNGQALAFNGSSSRVVVPDANDLHVTTALTMEVWVNPSSLNATWGALIYKGLDNYFIALPKNVPSLGIMLDGKVVLMTGAPVMVNVWTHLALTWDGQLFRLYVNGVQRGTQAAKGVPTSSPQPLEIGGSKTDQGWFAGMIDDVKIYNTLLTSAEIQADMNRPAGPVLIANIGKPRAVNGEIGVLLAGVPGFQTLMPGVYAAGVVAVGTTCPKPLPPETVPPTPLTCGRSGVNVSSNRFLVNPQAPAPVVVLR